MFKLLICLVLGYFFGCISTSYMVGKINKIDIRHYGSGNAGTTNALRTLGLKAGAITFLGDALKAVAAVFIVRFLIFPNEEIGVILSLYTGIGVILGHNFPFWLQFKGGKGIAATGGVMLAIDWRLAAAAIVVFGLTVLFTRYVSLGSLLISLLFPIWLMLQYPGNIHIIILAWIYTIFAFIKHRSNIRRLINKTERKIGQRVDIKDNTN